MVRRRNERETWLFWRNEVKEGRDPSYDVIAEWAGRSKSTIFRWRRIWLSEGGRGDPRSDVPGTNILPFDGEKLGLGPDNANVKDRRSPKRRVRAAARRARKATQRIEKPKNATDEIFGHENLRSRVDAIATDLSAGQRIALFYLLRGTSYSLAAKAAGVSDRTVNRWLNDNALFQAAMREVNRDIFNSTKVSLIAGSCEGVEAIRESIAALRHVTRQAIDTLCDKERPIEEHKEARLSLVSVARTLPAMVKLLLDSGGHPKTEILQIEDSITNYAEASDADLAKRLAELRAERLKVVGGG